VRNLNEKIHNVIWPFSTTKNVLIYVFFFKAESSYAINLEMHRFIPGVDFEESETKYKLCVRREIREGFG